MVVRLKLRELTEQVLESFILQTYGCACEDTSTGV